MEHVHAGAEVSPGRREYTFTGATHEAMRRLGGRSVLGSGVQVGNMAGSLMVVRGKPTIRPTGQIAAQATQPSLAQLIQAKKVNLIYALPGQATDYASWLAARFGNSAVARQIIEAHAPRLREKFGIDLKKVMDDEVESNVLMSSRYSQPLIALAQAIANAELKEMGYDLSQPNVVVVGHSQGVVMGLQAIGALSEEDAIDILARDGIFMQDSDPWVGSGAW